MINLLDPEFTSGTILNEDPYSKLKNVLDAAYDQAKNRKGQDRHAYSNNERFENQIICEVARRVGNGYQLGQAVKKIYESQRLSTEGAIEELLGAINYIAAAVILLQEKPE